MNLWKKYRSLVYRQCRTELIFDGGLNYWRDRLFVETIIYMLPLCMIALIPGVYLSFTTGYILLGMIDLLSGIMLAVVAFVPVISLNTKKGFFLLFIYVLAVVLVYYLGLFGPGLLYFFSGSVFAILFLPKKKGILSSVVNAAICTIFAVFIYHGYLPWKAEISVSLGTWIAVSSNLIFLSALMAVLIPKLFNGLQSTIEKKIELEQELKRHNDKLIHSMNQLEQKTREVEEFSLLAAHDLKEPLRNINTMLRIIKRDHIPLKTEKVERYLEIIDSSSRRMINLIEDLTAYTQIGLVKGEYSCIDLYSFLGEIFAGYTDSIEKEGGSVVLRKLPEVYSQAGSLDRIFRNLISNSIKYRSKNRPLLIEIWGESDTDHHNIYYKDNGIGIAEEFVPSAFKLFNRFHDEANYEGTGLGLATCKKVTQLLGGDITLKSGTGLGCEFCITLKKGK